MLRAILIVRSSPTGVRRQTLVQAHSAQRVTTHVNPPGLLGSHSRLRPVPRRDPRAIIVARAPATRQV